MPPRPHVTIPPFEPRAERMIRAAETTPLLQQLSVPLTQRPSGARIGAGVFKLARRGEPGSHGGTNRKERRESRNGDDYDGFHGNALQSSFDVP